MERRRLTWKYEATVARDQIVGLALKENSLEWSVLQPVKERIKTVSGDRAELVAKSEKTDSVLSDETLNRIKASCTGIRGRVSLGLPTSQLLLRVVNLPSVDPVELKSMVELQMDKISPFPVENMIISYEILRMHETTSVVLIGATRKEVVESAGKMLSQTGLRIARVDATILGWLRLLSGADQIAREGCQVVLLIDGHMPEIIVVMDGIPVAFRSLGDIGDLSRDELVSEISSELNYTLISLDLEYGTVAVNRISVWYSGAVPDGLSNTLSRQYGCEIQLSELAALPGVSEGIATRLAECDGNMFDLRPVSWLQAERAKQFGGRVLTAGSIILGVWLMMAVALLGALSYQKWQLGRLRTEQNKWSRPALEVRAMRRRVGMIAKYTNTTHSALECLRDITVRMPPSGIDLTSFSYRKGEDVKITGEADSAELVLNFNENLNNSKLFTEVKSGSMSITRKHKHRFGMELILPGGE
ncbi:MAG: pilus assembly protein PilM [Lentisphaerae bacterium]|nr:pilus assembly protein PilM [Lentisphaerota bacterium]